MFIVARNYRDRSSENRWLVRDAEASIDSAEEAAELVLHDVEFISSVGYPERSFGCITLGKAGSVAREVPSTEGMREVNYLNGSFCDVLSGRLVEKARCLVLRADGKSFYTPA